MAMETVTVTITAKVDKQGKKVILHGSKVPADPKDGDTFLVNEGDTLQWKLLDKGGDKAADLEGSKLRIRFVSPQGPALLDKGSSLETSGALISGKVTADSRPGRYRYAVELVNPAGSSEPVTELVCHWDTEGQISGMGGGERSGG
jgi:hypothetical protein